MNCKNCGSDESYHAKMKNSDVLLCVELAPVGSPFLFCALGTKFEPKEANE